MFFDKYLANKNKNSIRLSFSKEVREKVIKKLLENNFLPNDADNVEEIIEDYIVFPIAAFHALRDSVNVWKDIFDSVDYVIGKLNDDEIAEYVFCCIVWHYKVKVLLSELENVENQTEMLYNFCIEMGEDIITLSDKLNFYPHVVSYGKKLLIDDNPEIGTREQDKEETTFYPDESRQVCCIYIVCKLFFPIIAAMIAESKSANIVRTFAVEGSNSFVTKKQRLISTNMKEVYCLYFMEPLLKNLFPEVYEKLFNYGIHYLNTKSRTKRPQQNQSSDVFMNLSQVEMNKQVMANLLCKKGIVFSLSQKSESVMGFTMGEIKKKITNLDKTNIKFKVRSIQSSGDGEDEGNEAQLEADSTISSTTMEKEPITMFTWEKCVERYKKKLNIPDELFNNAVEYYSDTLDLLDDYITSLMNNAFHSWFTSCEAVELLYQKQVIALMVIVQIYAINNDMFDLAVKLTSKKKKIYGEYELSENRPEYGAVVAVVDTAMRSINQTLGPCKTTLNIKDKVPLVTSAKLTMKQWAIEFTQVQSYVNIYPEILKMLNTKLPEQYHIQNDSPYHPSAPLMIQICEIIDKELK